MLKRILLLALVGMMPFGLMAQATTTVERGEMEDLISNVFFDFDVSKLDNNARIAVEDIFNNTTVPECANLLLVGYADERGTPYYNIKLGWARAFSVRDMLVQKGFSKDRIIINSLGATTPTRLWETVQQDYKYNRLVEIYIAPRESWYRDFKCKQDIRDGLASE